MVRPPCSSTVDLRRLAVVYTPMTESALGGVGGHARPFLVRWVLGTWIAMRVHVELLGRVDAADGGRGIRWPVLEGAQRAEVEDRPEVDVEALAPLAREDPAAVEADAPRRAASAA